MARYDLILDRLMTRAVGQAVLDLEGLVLTMRDQGVSKAAIQERLLDDIDNDGPVFGRFIRSLQGASSSAAMAAVRQGELMGTIQGDANVQRLLGIQDMRDIIDGADTASAAIIEERARDIPHTWIAELRNTCPRCLPLHGSTQTLGKWNEIGFSPGTIHTGWDAACHCRLIPESQAKANGVTRSDLVDPLVRVKDKGASAGVRKSVRVALSDVDPRKSFNASQRAAQSKEGAEVLQKLGRANANRT